MSDLDNPNVVAEPETCGSIQAGCAHVQKPGYSISFPPEHKLCNLWRLWANIPEPTACLQVCVSYGDDQARELPPEKLERDRQRIQHALGYIGKAYVDKVCRLNPLEPHGLDEAVFIIMSGDEMDAWLFLLPPVKAGAELTVAQIHKCLLQQGIRVGIDWQSLCEIAKCQQRYFQLFHVAGGRDPAPGSDGRVLDRVSRVLEDVKVQQLGGYLDGALNMGQDIQKGDVICEIQPPMAGIPGQTVTGKVLAACDGLPAEVPQGRNTVLSGDGRYLLAERDGRVYFSGESFQVRPVLRLSESEIPPERAIKFLGDVHICGDLPGGVSICTSGNIQVDGVVENCSLEAGENVIVSGGVQGQGHAVVQAHQSVYAKYLEQCVVCARESVGADCIINCSVYCNGTVMARNGRSTIIGGTICAAQEVSAGNVGSKAERPTSIVLGGQPWEEAEQAQIQAELKEIERELAKLDYQPKSPAREQRQSKLRLNQCVAKMKLEKIDRELETKLVSDLERDICRFTCDIVFPGTTITIGRSSMRITREERAYTVGYRDGLVCCL